ncbi:helix-turn-helix transcriptional regulator [Harryflintia acetispora]|uniref:DNA-binding transcriptional regulator YafY n=1 Tax=Harryflintia acetispora TaxID=1849041 RepID=A0A9X8Y8F1_9FIRM|nr:YafY family protein [Harryflintia acetispora]TCL43724.1 putative DNA-binding transcriptional regulator YafY [Harryflintia acetispora]
MQSGRLFEIVYLLLERGQLTARELAARFEVSERTIYRDIEALSMSGVPVYCAKGRHGGIRLMEGFVLERSLLSESQQEDILLALQSLSAAQYGDMTGVLSQLGALFRKENLDWLQVDFSPWGSGPQSQQAFELLKKAVAGRRVIEFDYCASNGQRTHREAEGLQLRFKDKGWYLWAYCRRRQEPRLFRVTRIRNLRLLGETFERRPLEQEPGEQEPAGMICLRLRVDRELSYRVYDEFDETDVRENPDGSFEVRAYLPEDGWVYGYVLSFGPYAEVLGPPGVREGLAALLREMGKIYEP